MERLRFEDDCNLDFECRGFLCFVKSFYEHKIFSVEEIAGLAGISEKVVKRILRRIVGHGYARRSNEIEEWEPTLIFAKKRPKLYRWEEYVMFSIESSKQEKAPMDRKMRKVSKELRKGEKVIEKAARKNDKLANYDEKVRDPMIAKYKKMKKK